MKKRLLSILLALLFGACLVPPALAAPEGAPMDSDWETKAITTDTLDLTMGLESRPVEDFYDVVNTLLALDHIGQVRLTMQGDGQIYDLDRDGTDDILVTVTPDGKTTTIQLVGDYSLKEDRVFTLSSIAIEYLYEIQAPGYCEELKIKLPPPKTEISFPDVPADAYYAEAVAWAVENQVTTGTAPGTFSPDGDCTRGQVLTFLWRAVGSPEPKTASSPFQDVKADDYFCSAVLWASENKIASGTSGTTFSPSDHCTRGQVVTFLYRMMSASPPEDPADPFTDVGPDDYYYAPVLWAVASGVTSGAGDGTFCTYDVCTRAQVVTFLCRALGGTWTKWGQTV